MSKTDITGKPKAKGKTASVRARIVGRDAKTGQFLNGGGSLHAVRNKKARKAATASDEWSAFDNLDDRDIDRAAAADPDTAPVDDDDFWNNARVVMPVPKQAISIRLDEDVLMFFKETGPGYQSRINAVLRSYMEAKK